jgi:AcrR family transcriptional regulator
MKKSIRPRNTRQQILDAAQRLIEKEGFNRLTTSEIAREAGYAEGTIFKHFQRKDDLSLAVVLENAPRFRDVIAGKQAGTGSVQKNLQDITLAALRFSEKLIPMAAALLADANLLRRQRQALIRTGQGPREAFDLIASYVSQEQQLGRISRRLTPLMVSSLLLGSCFHRAFLRQTLGRHLLPMKDGEFASALVFTLINGLRQV